MNRHFTLLEWIVVFSLLIFLVIKSADAKPRKQKHYEIPNHELSIMVTDITTDTIVRGHNIDKIGRAHV